MDLAAIAFSLRSILADSSRKDEFSGAVLVRQGDQDLLRAAYGDASRPWQIKNQVHTRFRIASISKMFTAIAILQLIERGQLDFTTGVVAHLSLPDSLIPADVTVYHLLTMTAGIADWFEESGDWQANWAALCQAQPLYLLRCNADYLPLFAHKSPLAPAGAHYQYNNAGYILLGLLIEQASGLSYPDYLRRNIFSPAQMTQADFLALDGVDAEVAEGYSPVLDGQGRTVDWRKNIYTATPEAAADGGASATLEDLSRFGRSLRSGLLLSPAMTREMLTPQVMQNEPGEDEAIWQYGYGNQFLLTPDGQILRWGHTGEEEGVSCRLFYYPQLDVEVVILGNQSGCAGPLGWQIHDVLLGG